MPFHILPCMMGSAASMQLVSGKHEFRDMKVQLPEGAAAAKVVAPTVNTPGRPTTPKSGRSVASM